MSTYYYYYIYIFKYILIPFLRLNRAYIYSNYVLFFFLELLSAVKDDIFLYFDFSQRSL